MYVLDKLNIYDYGLSCVVDRERSIDRADMRGTHAEVVSS